MELDKLFGLPAHPLLVHIPVVLVPLASLGLVVIAVSAAARAKIGWYVLGLSFIAAAGTLFAANSGESLQQDVARSATLREHTQLGDQMQPIAVVLLLATAAVMSVSWYYNRKAKQAAADGSSTGGPSSGVVQMGSALRIGMVVVSMAVAGLSTVWVARTGHEGAKATWEAENGRSAAPAGTAANGG